MNSVHLTGRATRDAELRYTPNGTPVMDVGLACEVSRYKNKDGEWQSKVAFVDCTFFVHLAETAATNIKKGVLLDLVGKLDQDEWTDKEGGARKKLCVKAYDYFIHPSSRKTNRSPEQTESEPLQTVGAPTTEPSLDDIPF